MRVCVCVRVRGRKRGRKGESKKEPLRLCERVCMDKTLLARKTELKDMFCCHSAKLNRRTSTV